MSKIITIPFTEPFLPHVVDYIYHHYMTHGKDLSRLAVIFGGRRPSLFIKKDLAKRIGSSYIPPKFFTIDEWMAFVADDAKEIKVSGPLDHAYAIYKIAQEKTPAILNSRESFAQFLPWAQEILRFIEQLDLEDVPLASLKVVEQHAQIGYGVPDDINDLLGSLSILRQAYHAYLERGGFTTRGYQYLQASRRVGAVDLSAFDEILFCNFFYLHKSEDAVIKHIYGRSQVVMLMQGDERRWPALKRIGKTFGTPVVEGKDVVETTFDLKVYEAFDSHAQGALVKEILQGIDEPESAVIVLPNADTLLPLLTAVGDNLSEFNISMGYPLKRSALYALLDFLVQAQNTRRGELYYARDYLRLLAHPLVKNLDLAGDPALVRLLVYRIEEALKGLSRTAISGVLFIDLNEVLADEALWASFPDPAKMRAMLQQMHEVFFLNFHQLNCSAQLAKALEVFIVFMQAHSAMDNYPFNAQIALRLGQVAQEFAGSSFALEPFGARELFRILQERLSGEIVAFNGSPLRGLQVLGLFETRALNFKHVIVLDVNEGVLPNLNIYERLVPREVMIKLNLDRLELEEEIQRYGFMRLISSAQKVHLIYQQNSDKVRSRLVEELIWEQEARKATIGVVDILRPSFAVSVGSRERVIPKTPQIIDFLKELTFSASSLNAYLRNPYDFYCQYVLGLRIKDDLLDDPQSRQVGTFIHDLLEEAFKVFLNKTPVIDEQFNRFFQKIYQARFDAVFGKAGRSDTFLMKTVLEARLERFIKEEADRCLKQVDKVLFIERKFEDSLQLGAHRLKLSYRVDRVDLLKDGTVLLLDYKTGGAEVMPKGIDLIEHLPMTRENIRDHIKSFQMPLYVHYLSRQYPNQPVNAALYHLRTMDMQYFMAGDVRGQIERSMPVYLKALQATVEEILNPDLPFKDDPMM